MEVLLMAVFTVSNIICFMVGAKVGQKVSKGEEVKLPNPVKVIQEHQEQKEAKKEQDRFDTILKNIESYDGTSIGQKEVPRG